MPKNVLVIGGVALGPKAACRFKRLEPESKVTLIDQVSSALLNSSMICAMSTYSSAPAR